MSTTSSPSVPAADDPVAAFFKPDHRSTCVSPMPMLHWLYLQLVVDEKYEVQQQPAVATSRPAPPVPPQR